MALHITVIAGGWLIDELGSPVWVLAVLVAIKTAADLGIAAFFAVHGESPAAALKALRRRKD